MSKHEVFLKEINYMKNSDYIKNTKILLDLLPDYFYEVAASSTGKYHPKCSLGCGGLVRHTKVAVRIAHELLNNQIIGSKFDDREKDLIIISLLLHDGLKYGLNQNKYTAFEHPLLIAEFVKNNGNKTSLNDEDIEFIASAVETHMGQWNTNPYSDAILPIPKNKYQKFVHMCDDLASKKFINVEFDGNEIID